MAKRAHWTTEQVLEEVMSDEEPVEQDLGDWELDGDDRGEVDRDEPVMEGSDEEFSDFEFDDPDGRVHWEKIYTNNSEQRYLP